eukprot:TRINITY_DN9716_c0_g1_i1.p1 TRINITY_DN9716_c0_g1~~TRINITY_DN9716_c0_g1_i1.p1  ORF type:complete len:393 (-),score=108.25 TRINITY_DN9716_c0_g1_i1:100-1278(-)
MNVRPLMGLGVQATRTFFLFTLQSSNRSASLQRLQQHSGRSGVASILTSPRAPPVLTTSRRWFATEEIDPKQHYHLVDTALNLQEQGKIEEAEAVYKQAFKLAPYSTAVVYNYATFLAFVKKDPAAAEEHYVSAIKLTPAGPSLAKIYVNYADLLQKFHKNNEKAVFYLKKAVDLDSDNSEARLNLAQLTTEECVNQKKILAAREKETSKTNDDDSEVWTQDELREKIDEVESMYHSLISSSEDVLPAYKGYGKVLLLLRDDAASAEPCFQTVYSQNPKDLEALLLYTKTLEKLNKLSEAKSVFEEGMEFHSDSVLFLMSRAYFLFRSNLRDYDGAEECYKRCLELDPENPEVYGSYAVFLSLGRKDMQGAMKAMAEFKRLVASKRQQKDQQ